MVGVDVLPSRHAALDLGNEIRVGKPGEAHKGHQTLFAEVAKVVFHVPIVHYSRTGVKLLTINSCREDEGSQSDSSQ